MQNIAFHKRNVYAGFDASVFAGISVWPIARSASAARRSAPTDTAGQVGGRADRVVPRSVRCNGGISIVPISMSTEGPRVAICDQLTRGYRLPGIRHETPSDLPKNSS